MSLPSFAQAPPPAAPPAAAAPASDEATHNELRALRDGLLDAMRKGDIERELTFFHPNAVVTWHNAEVSRGRDGIRKYLTRMLQGPNKAVDSFNADVNVDELTILYGGDTGIAFGSAVEHFKMASGRNFDLPARWSATMVKENGQWLIANLHSSDNLFDNPLLDSAKRTIGWTGAIGLAVGLAIGIFIGRRRRTA
ncbi:MAG: polyketide cyclase [Acidobacteria bacterium]|nr:MAG: polyketide cyclase [Acidobacteriota bacterium]